MPPPRKRFIAVYQKYFFILILDIYFLFLMSFEQKSVKKNMNTYQPEKLWVEWQQTILFKDGLKVNFKKKILIYTLQFNF